MERKRIHSLMFYVDYATTPRWAIIQCASAVIYLPLRACVALHMLTKSIQGKRRIRYIVYL